MNELEVDPKAALGVRILAEREYQLVAATEVHAHQLVQPDRGADRRHGFEDAVGETLLMGAQDAEIGAAKDCRHVITLAEPANITLDAERRCTGA